MIKVKQKVSLKRHKNKRAIFYEEPFYKGSHSLVEWSVVVLVVVVIFISSSLILSLILAICLYIILLKVTPRVVLCDEKIIIKHSIRITNRVEEINYSDCISINDAVTSDVSKRYNISYFENRKKKEISFFILDKKTYTLVIEFLQKKNEKLKINTKKPLF